MPVETASVSNEYTKSPNLRKEDVEALQQWMDKQPHLPKISELDIILFLHSCYHKIEATKSTIDAFYTLKTHFTDVFANRDPNWPNTRSAMECTLFAQLPERTPEGYMILFFTFIDKDPSKFVGIDQMKILDMNTRLWLHEVGTTEGLFIVIDVKHFGLAHLARLTITSLKYFFSYLQEAFPVRLKGIHFINAGTAAEKLLSLSKPLMKPELLEIVKMHAAVSDEFYKSVPKENLPKEYGGDGDSIYHLQEIMKTKLLDNAEYFIEDEKLKADESKRVSSRPNLIITDYGIDGSFKKLEVD